MSDSIFDPYPLARCQVLVYGVTPTNRLCSASTITAPVSPLARNILPGVDRQVDFPHTSDGRRQPGGRMSELKSHLLELVELERQGSYVFHGSGKFHKQLEPRQAYTVVQGRSVKDGEPAVFASE